MKSLDEVARQELKDFLGKGWLTHDGMWFYHTYLNSGMDEANKLNREAIKTLAATEMARAKKVLEVSEEDLKTFEGLRDFLLESLRLILPESVFSRSSFYSPADNILRWEWQDGECFAYKGMKQIGVIDDYICGVIYRIQCWFEHLGIPYEVEPRIEKCIMHQTGKCSGKFIVSLPTK
jgi:Family of unknown function (DUF6125)